MKKYSVSMLVVMFLLFGCFAAFAAQQRPQGIYQDILGLLVMDFQGDRMTYYRFNIPLAIYVVKVEGNKLICLGQTKDAPKRVEFDYRNEGGVIYLNGDPYYRKRR